MPITTVLFDLDDTLTDAAVFGASVLAAAIDAHGHALSVEVIQRYPGAPYIPLIEREIGVGTDEATAIYATYVRMYRDMMRDGLREHAGASDLLRALAAREVRLGLVTNKLEALAREILGLYGWTSMFGAVVGQDSCEYRKPDPRIVGHALGILGGSADATAFIGDTPSDMQCARDAGVSRVIGLLSTTPGERLSAAGAAILVPALVDVIEVLGDEVPRGAA